MNRKEYLESLNRNDLVEAAKKAEVKASGKSVDIIERILEKEKPTFKDMVDSAPVSKDGNITVEIEEIETSKEEEPTTETDGEPSPPPDDEELKDEETEPPVPPISEELKWMIPENKVHDVLSGWNATIRGFYQKNVSGIAPARPQSSKEIADLIGLPTAVSILENWKGSIISQCRPPKGFAPITPLSIRSLISKLKNELGG